jgi:hypothetical protein
MKKQTQAREEIIRIWDELGAHNAKSDATTFWFYLRNNHPDALDFRSPGSDAREAVKSWLIAAGRLRIGK